MQIGASSLGKKANLEGAALLAGIGVSRNVQGIVVHPKTSGQGWKGVKKCWVQLESHPGLTEVFQQKIFLLFHHPF